MRELYVSSRRGLCGSSLFLTPNTRKSMCASSIVNIVRIVTDVLWLTYISATKGIHDAVRIASKHSQLTRRYDNQPITLSISVLVPL